MQIANVLQYNVFHSVINVNLSYVGSVGPVFEHGFGSCISSSTSFYLCYLDKLCAFSPIVKLNTYTAI